MATPLLCARERFRFLAGQGRQPLGAMQYGRRGIIHPIYLLDFSYIVGDIYSPTDAERLQLLDMLAQFAHNPRRMIRLVWFAAKDRVKASVIQSTARVGAWATNCSFRRPKSLTENSAMGIGSWLQRAQPRSNDASSFQMLTLADAHRLIAPVVDSALDGRGFESVAPLRWVRFDGTQIRQMFGFAAWKGGAIAPRWGFSFDFVPHLSGNAVRWHRTNKSATFDLCVDARDRILDVSLIRGEQALVQMAPRIVETAVSRSDELWRRVHSLPDVIAGFEWLRGYLSGGGLGFYNYTQHPIALAFVLAKIGDKARAQQELEHFLKAQIVDDSVSDRVRKLLAEASTDS